MDITELIAQLRCTNISSNSTTVEPIQVYLETIIDSINDTAQLGSNILVYEIITLSDNDIKQLRNELLTLFPDMTITISEKRLIIDWS
jgi:hypothetical protein